MPTIVEYTDLVPAKNEYPSRVVSPTGPGPCCAVGMADLGAEQREERMDGAWANGFWVWRYRRCPECGFTVRRVVRFEPDPRMVEELRRTLATAFTRNDPGT